MMFFEEYLNIN